MASLNKVMLIGNLTRDAELRYIPSGSAVLDFRLAVNRKYKKQDGTEADETCFVDVCLWGKRGEAVSQYLTKGKPLFVEGRLQMDEWNDKTTGEKRSKLRVVAENIEFLGAGGGGGGGQRADAGSFDRGEEGAPSGAPSGPASAPRGGYNNNAPRGGGPGPSGPTGGGHGNGHGNAMGNGMGNGNGAPSHAPAQQYARPATAPGGSMASAMQVDQDDIPF